MGTSNYKNRQKKPVVKTILISVLLLLVSAVHAQENNSSDSLSAKKNKLLELSFGQSLLFISEGKAADLHKEEAIVIPTSSVLFFTEFRPLKKVRFPLYTNIATESKQFIVDSVLVNEKVNPDFGFGVQYEVINVSIDKTTLLQFEGGALANFIFPKKSKMKLSPVLAGRLRFIKQENFVMYIGPTYAIGIKTWGLIFGTGYIF